MEQRINKIWDVDKQLFTTMETNSISKEEYNFFQNMYYKETCEISLSNDLIMSEDDNTDNIYIVREIYEEYVIGYASHPEKEVHVMNLTEALNIKLSDIGLENNNMTLLQWLGSINYKGITYNHNYDII